MLTNHAPIKTKDLVQRPRVPWFNQEKASLKRDKRQCEKHWCKTGLVIHRDICKEKRQAISSVYTPFTGSSKCAGDQHKLYDVVNKLMNRKQHQFLPVHDTVQSLCNSFSKYFVNKIYLIRTAIDLLMFAVAL